MNLTKRLGGRVLGALSVAVVVASVAAAGASGSARSHRAGEVEADIVRTNIVGKMKATLGSAFGGVWFEPSTAQLHVGVVSPAARRLAETAAVRAGLPETVTETPVASTWAQLQAAQDRWDERLWDLLERGEAATALDPERSAVEVELGSLVSPLRRTALDLEAESDSVNVSIKTTPHPHLRVEPKARCKEHAKNEAYCDPTLVAGQSFVSDPVTQGGVTPERCTTGPAVIKKNFVDPTKTYVLTAGHCIEYAGGVNKKWYAYNTKAEKKEVGLAIAFLNAETDVGVVEVTTSDWAKQAEIPVEPMIAPWDQEEPEPFRVIKEEAPTVGMRSCMSGQTTGTVEFQNCGEIVTLDQTIEVEGVVTKNLVEVKEAKVTGGDSGGPWYSEAPFKEGLKGYVEGTTVGEKGATKNPVFQSLATSFAELKKLKGIDLELLTLSNELRVHTLTSPADTAISESTTIEAESESATSLDGTIKVTCNKSTVKGKNTEKGGSSGPVEALTFSECGNNTVTVVKGGTLTIEPTTAPNGTLSSTGAEITVLIHGFLLGTVHCIYATNATDIGTFTGSGTTKGNATLDIDSAVIPQVATDGACGSESTWTGSYKVTAPTYLDMD